MEKIPEGMTAVRKGGRCWNGAHRDAGVVIHVVPGTEPNGAWFTKALCGAEPGRRSYGWAPDSRDPNCANCLKNINKK